MADVEVELALDYHDRRPIYEQLIERIRALILCGELTPGAQLPSVRALAAELAINPNTIQKAYTELERRGMICSVSGRGSFVTQELDAVLRECRADLLTEVERTVLEARRGGVTRDSIEDRIARIWRDENDRN